MDGLQQQCQESDSNQHPKTVADKIPAKSIPKLRIVKGLLDSKWLPLSATVFGQGRYVYGQANYSMSLYMSLTVN